MIVFSVFCMSIFLGVIYFLFRNSNKFCFFFLLKLILNREILRFFLCFACFVFLFVHDLKYNFQKKQNKIETYMQKTNLQTQQTQHGKRQF